MNEDLVYVTSHGINSNAIVLSLCFNGGKVEWGFEQPRLLANVPAHGWGIELNGLQGPFLPKLFYGSVKVWNTCYNLDHRIFKTKPVLILHPLFLAGLNAQGVGVIQKRNIKVLGCFVHCSKYI